MNLIIESSLSEPPSNITLFRDVNLYARTYIFEDILLMCEEGTRSFYWNWLKKFGAQDFISYLIKTSEIESGFLIARKKANLNINRISYDNYDFIISSLKTLHKS